MPKLAAFDPPDTMTVGDTKRIDFTLPARVIDRLTADFSGELDNANPVTGRAEVHLGGDLGVNVGELREPTKSLAAPAPPEWSFIVEAATAGSKELALEIDIYLVAATDDMHHASYTLSGPVEVRSSVARTILGFGQKNWQWIVGTLLIPAGAGLLHWQKKKKA